MNKVEAAEGMKKIYAVNGIDVFHMYSTRFKTNSVNLFMLDNLDRQRVFKNAILSGILTKGSHMYPSAGAVEELKEDLMITGLGSKITRKGEYQIIQFYAEYISDQYMGTNSFEDVFSFLYQFLQGPLLENNMLPEGDLLQEINNLKHFAEGKMQKKSAYAISRCLEEMCKEEAFSLGEYNHIADLNHLNRPIIHRHYEDMMTSLPICIIVIGDMEEEAVIRAMEVFKSHPEKKPVVLNKTNKEIKSPKKIIERTSLSQERLALGYRTNIIRSDSDHYAMLVYNSILGGGLYSRLFENLRQKMGLVYDAFSFYEEFKGLQVISSGTDIGRADEVTEAILKQVEQIKEGSITDEELNISLQSLAADFNSFKDKQFTIIDYYLKQYLAGTLDDIDTYIEKINSVTKEAVVRASQKIKLDTIYQLRAEV